MAVNLLLCLFLLFWVRLALYFGCVGDLEHQFTILREQLYQERIRQNEMHLNDVRNGRSQAYLEPLKELTEVMQNRIEVAGILKRYRLENIEHKFLAEEQAARQHFEVKINKYFIRNFLHFDFFK